MRSSRASQELHKDELKQTNYGRSARAWAFDFFDDGSRPVHVARTLDIDQATAFRYYQQWKKLPPFFKYKYKAARLWFRRLGYRNRKKISRVLARELGTSVKEVSFHMQKPWAVKQIVSGEWRKWPVNRTRGQRKHILNSMLGKAWQLAYPREAKYILDLAMNQHIDPFEGEREPEEVSEDSESQ
jgi:hypothetical protein